MKRISSKLNSLSLSENKQSLLVFSIIGIFALLLFRGAFYGVATPDESFYLTIPYRIILGDALLIDEWHASQLSAFLLYLPMKLFISITGSTDGIVLFFRCLFVLCQTGVSCFTYIRLKKYGKIPALLSALLFLTYITEQVHMLDYYTMSLMGFQVSGLILLTDDKPTKFKLIFTGIVFACTVTAQPFNCAVYFIYSLTVLVFFFVSKKREYSAFAKRILSAEAWFLITVGIVLTAIVFLIFMLSQAPLGELIANIGNLFSGQDHNLPGSTEADSDMFSYLTLFKTLISFTPVSFFASALVVLLIALDKKRNERKKLWLCAGVSVTALYFILLLISSAENTAALLFRPYPLFLMTFILIILKKKTNRELLSLFISGILYTVFLGIISQALDYVGAIGLVLSNTALIPAAKELMDEEKEEKQKKPRDKESIAFKAAISTASAIAVICILTGGLLEFADSIISAQFGREAEKTEITLSDGPLKGIKTEKSVSLEYYSVLDDLEEIRENTDGRVLVAGLIPWTYFCFDEPPATFTTWYIKNELYMFDSYYGDESRRPDCIYIPSTSFYWNDDHKSLASSYTRFFRVMFDGQEEKGEIGTIFYVNKMR